MSVKSLRNQLLAAIAMVLVAALSLGSSTFAWFTMNSEVKAEGMKVTAKAEAGLLINEVQGANSDYWDNLATAQTSPNVDLVPISTTTGKVWYHANSKIASDEAGATAANTASTSLAGKYGNYTDVLKVATTAATDNNTSAGYAIGYIDSDGDDAYNASKDNAHYVKYTYYLRVSNQQGLDFSRLANAQNVAIKDVTATKTGSYTSADLDKALRVGVVIGGKMYIYAPRYSGSDVLATYFVVTASTHDTDNDPQGITTATVDAFKTGLATPVYTALTHLPGMTGNGEQVDIYVWFEGEDDYCQSDKISETLDQLNIDVTFSLETIGGTAPAAITNNEFTVPTT